MDYLTDEMTRAFTIGLIEASGKRMFGVYQRNQCAAALGDHTFYMIRKGHIYPLSMYQIFYDFRFPDNVSVKVKSGS